MLSSDPHGLELTLSWTTEKAPLYLETSSSLGRTELWTAEVATPVRNGNQMTVHVSIGTEPKFYRLNSRKPQ